MSKKGFGAESEFWHPSRKPASRISRFAMSRRSPTSLGTDTGAFSRALRAALAARLLSFESEDAILSAREPMPVVAEVRRSALAALFPAQEHYFSSRGIRRDQIVLRIPKDPA